MDSKWLEGLEKNVETAVAELTKLRKENDAQGAKIKQLQKQLAEAKNRGESASQWDNERAEIQKRVEKLSAGLEKLL